MNIITLFDSLKTNFNGKIDLTNQEIIRIEKQINVEKKINKDIDTNTASNLILALKNHTEAFNFVYNNPIFYNFFTNKPFPKKTIPTVPSSIEEEKVRVFIDEFLTDDLLLFFNKNISKNDFIDCITLLNEKEYLPEEILFKLNKRIDTKIEFGIAQLSKSPIDKTKILYLKDKNFYLLLNHFCSTEMDWKINNLISISADLYNRNRVKDFIQSTMKAMSFYTAEDPDIVKVLKDNKKVVSDWFGINMSSLGTRGIFFGIFILIKLLTLSKCS